MRLTWVGRRLPQTIPFLQPLMATYKIIVDQNVYISGVPRHLGDEVQLDGVIADQLIRSKKIEAVAAPEIVIEDVKEPEPSHDVPKKQGKAIRPGKSK